MLTVLRLDKVEVLLKSIYVPLYLRSTRQRTQHRDFLAESGLHKTALNKSTATVDARLAVAGIPQNPFRCSGNLARNRASVTLSDRSVAHRPRSVEQAS